jgi:hypothetical protein
MTGESDLALVTALTYQIDTGARSLTDLLAHLPALRALTLDAGSSVTSLRELGSGARQLEALSLVDCGLLELDGVAALRRLRELRVARNHLFDLEPLGACAAPLETLDLADCLVWDFAQLDFLGALDRLRALSLRGCPLAHHAAYRRRVCARLVDAGAIRLRALDDEPPSVGDLALVCSAKTKSTLILAFFMRIQSTL